MKLLVACLLLTVLALSDAGVVKRQVDGADTDSFWNNFQPTTSTTRRPNTTRPALQRCLANCPSTNEYNPVCGSNGQQYQNIGRLNCARNCGVAVTVATRAACNPLT